MKNFRKLGLNLFDGEASAEGGDATTTTTTPETTPEPTQVQPSTPDNTSVQQRAEAGFMSRLQSMLTGASNPEANESTTIDNSAENTNPTQDDKSLSDIEKRIADIEYREQQMAMKESGVSADKLSDAMTLFKASGESDMAKFLESRPYLTAGDVQAQTQAQNAEPQPYKHELSDMEKYLKAQGAL